MSRALRKMLPLAARSWLIVSSAVLMAGVSLPGCTDENDPATWVKRLDDPGQKLRSIKRLQEFFNDSMNKGNDKLDDPQVVAVLDKIVEPLARTYVSGNLDDKTREEVLQSLASMKDARAQTAYAKALKDYEPGKTDRELRFASQAVIGLAVAQKPLDPALLDTLWSAFAKYRPSKTTLSEPTRYLHDAILAVKHKDWGPKAAELLKAPASDDVDSKKDQLYFLQLTAVQLIAELKDERAVPALTEALLTPIKAAELRGPLKNAFVSIPIASTRSLVAVLEGKAFAEKAKDFQPAQPAGYMTALVADSLGHISRPEGRDAVLAALGTADLPPMARFGLAQSLVLFPVDPRVVPAFQGAIAKLPPGEKTNGLDMRAGLMQIASMFYDPNMVDSLLKESINAKGDEGERVQMRMLTLDPAIKVMNVAQKGAVEEAVKKTEAELKADPTKAKYVRDMFKLAAEVGDRCKEDASCYIKVLSEPIPAGQPAANTKQVKAAYMAAIYGGGSNAAQTRSELMKKVDGVKDPAARLAIVQAVDRLAPEGDQKAADDFDKLVESDKKIADKTTLMASDAVAKVAKRLRARAAK